MTRYYFDFCEKYHLNELKKETLIHFIAKLKDKKQNAQQQKQAYHAISLFYESAGSLNSEKVALLNTKDDKIATKKDALKKLPHHVCAGQGTMIIHKGVI